jgi:hypothetical protein
VVLSPAEAEEQATPTIAKSPALTNRIWLGKCCLVVRAIRHSPKDCMPLRRQKLLFLFAFAVACTDPSAPGSISAHFELTDVDGHVLPVTPPAGTGTSEPIVSGTMSMDQAGGAIITEDRIDSGGNRYTITRNYTYTIKNSTIEFADAIPCPIDAICVAPPTGQILYNGLRVKVVFAVAAPFQVYLFRTLPQ